ncbi:MAG: hypothetical protein INQ03_21990 [Candidatus Heimdallarchaeota archaeon]|nr:hypothetical protein [Candidatus Heimdallarchaeota archaeon]
MTQAYDLILMKSSGIPIYAGCTGSDYCMKHLGQHQLQTAFLSALYSFSQEAFDEEVLTKIDFSNIQLNFEIEHSKQLLFVGFHPKEVDSKQIQKLLQEALVRFNKRFPGEISDIVQPDDFLEFSKDLRELGLVSNQISSFYSMQDEEKTSKRGLLGVIQKIRELL